MLQAQSLLPSPFSGLARASSYRGHDVMPGGRRFLMVQDKEGPPEAAITEMVLVQDWFEELKRRAATGTAHS